MSSCVLLAVSEPEGEAHSAAAGLGAARLAALLARARGARLSILSVLTVPDPGAMSNAAAAAGEMRRRLGSLADALRPLAPDVHAAVRVGRNAFTELAAAAAEEGCELLVAGWGRPRPDAGREPRGEFGPVAQALLDRPPCDVVLVHPPPGRVRRVLVPVRGGPYAELAITLGGDLAGEAGAVLTVLHISRPDVPERLRWLEEAPYRAVMERLEAGRPVLKRLAASTEVAAALVEEARRHDLVVMGAHGPATTVPVALDFSRLRDRAGCGVLVVKTRQPLAEWLVSKPAWTPAAVDKWFAENTFDSEEFADLRRLLELKRRRGVTISLGLPALNEAETIGPLAACLRQALCEEVPLLDEIVVIDSGSDDGTREVAQAMGLPVHIHREILPRLGAHRGKGEALWKSLAVLRGDLIVWLDTDIRNPHPRLVYGLVGPLLAHRRLKYVKGYYSRPVQVGDRLYESGGGRVTELAARPLLNLFFPELSGFIQPLAGQYAGWREALEQVPFFTGYGVEVGLLIDILERFGLEAMGQVNLGRLVHRNSPLGRLSAMSFAIMQVVVKRLESWGRLQPLTPLHRTMKLIEWEEGRLALEVREIEEVERPPMALVPEYRRMRRSASLDGLETGAG